MNEFADVTGPIHTAATFFMLTVFESKFFSLFSLLFGMGFAIQLRRAEERKKSLFRLYWRRLVVLFALGWAHALIYPGDIVRLYAVLGFVLFLFRKWPPQRLVVMAIIVFVVDYSSWYFLSSDILSPVPPEAATVVEEVQEGPQPDLRAFSEVVAANLASDRWIGMFIGFGPSAFGLFLLGFGILRAGIVENIDNHRSAIRRFMWWMLCLGFPGAVLWSYGSLWQDGYASIFMRTFGSALYTLSYPTLALAYASFIALQFSKPAWYRVLRPLAAVGRVPLSAYVGQSVVYTTIFHGYGLGLYGRLGPAYIVPLAM